MSILDYTDRVYHFQYENITERERRCALVTSHLILTPPPPHSPQLLTEFQFVSVHSNRPGQAESATSILPHFFLSWWGSNWAPFGVLDMCLRYCLLLLVLESNSCIDSPMLFSACL